MKYIKTYERRNLKDFRKYADIVKQKFIKYIKIEKIAIYEEDNELFMEIKTWYDVNKDFFDFLTSEIGSVDFNIKPQNGSQLLITLNGVPESYFEQLDLEMDADRYNV